MACYRPVPAVRLLNGDVRFISRSVADCRDLLLPCSQCVGCRLEHRRQWAVRCLDEAQMHSENSFITLTMSPESVLKYGRSLDVTLFQKFMKRMRKDLFPKRIRVFYCGEYTKLFFPHFHALIFGHAFGDRKYFCKSKSGLPVYVSDNLSKYWDLGFSYIGDVSFDSAGYVAGYSMKKIGDSLDVDRLVMKDTGEVLRPEFLYMSRGGRGYNGVNLGGIGRSWYEKYKSDVYPIGSRVIRGRDMRPPKFYDLLYAADDAVGYEDLLARRVDSVDKGDNSMSRLVVKQEVTMARLKLFPRD